MHELRLLSLVSLLYLCTSATITASCFPALPNPADFPVFAKSRGTPRTTILNHISQQQRHELQLSEDTKANVFSPTSSFLGRHGSRMHIQTYLEA